MNLLIVFQKWLIQPGITPNSRFQLDDALVMKS